MECNHIWRTTAMPTPKRSKGELFNTVVSCGSSGYWLKPLEYAFAVDLINESKVEYCMGCNEKALVLPAEKRMNKVVQNTTANRQ